MKIWNERKNGQEISWPVRPEDVKFDYKTLERNNGEKVGVFRDWNVIATTKKAYFNRENTQGAYLIYDDGQGALALIASLYDIVQAISGASVGFILYLAFERIKLPYGYEKNLIFSKKK